MNNSIDIKKLVAIAGDESTKQGAYIGVDTVFFTTYGELYHQAKCKQAEPVAYTDGKEDFMSVATYEEYKKLGFFTKCTQPLYTTPQQPQSVADALEEAAKEIDLMVNTYVKSGNKYQAATQASERCVNKARAAMSCAETIRALIKRNAVKEGE